MTTVYCEASLCKFNKNGVCQSDSINLHVTDAELEIEYIDCSTFTLTQAKKPSVLDFKSRNGDKN